MATFDPDAYLAKSGGFDPDKYLGVEAPVADETARLAARYPAPLSDKAKSFAILH
jgi:hypothetical protein